MAVSGNAVADRGRHFVGGEHEAAVAGNRHHRHVAARVLCAKRGGKAPAEIVLVTGREEGARLVDRERQAGGKADLGDLVDQDAVLGQLGADGVEEGDLRSDRVAEPFPPRRLAACHLGLTRGAFHMVRRQHLEQSLEHRLGVADEGHGRLVQAAWALPHRHRRG
jgi:hypothetical protein